MWDWFVSLTNTEKVAAVGALSGFLVGIAGILFSRRGGKEKTPTARIIDGTVNMTVKNGDPYLAKKVEKILVLLSEERSTETAPEANEARLLKEISTRLLQSQDKQKKQIVAVLENGDLDTAIAKFTALDQEQSQHAKQQVQKAVETKLELAALLTYRDPDESERLLAEAVALEPDNPQANNQYGVLLLRLGRVDDAITAFKRVEVWAQTQGDSEWKGNALGNLGFAYYSLGQVKKAVEQHQQALVISRETKSRNGEANNLVNLGNAYANLGQIEKAIDLYQQALVISREIIDRKGEGNSLSNLGRAYADLGQVEKAIDLYKQALEISREINDRQNEGNTLSNLGRAYGELGQVEKAIKHQVQALEISREIRDRRGEGNTLGNLGLAYAELGKIEKAIEIYQQALVISQEIKDRQGEGTSLGNLGSAYAELGQVEKAREYYNQALKIFVETKSPNAEIVKRYLARFNQPSSGQ